MLICVIIGGALREIPTTTNWGVDLCDLEHSCRLTNRERTGRLWMSSGGNGHCYCEFPVCEVYLALSRTADETHISVEFGEWRRFIHQKWLYMEPCLITIAADWAKVNVIKWSGRQNYVHVFVLWGKLLFAVGKQPCYHISRQSSGVGMNTLL